MYPHFFEPLRGKGRKKWGFATAGRLFLHALVTFVAVEESWFTSYCLPGGRLIT